MRLQWIQLFTERKHVEVRSKIIKEEEGKGRRGRSRVRGMRGIKKKSEWKERIGERKQN